MSMYDKNHYNIVISLQLIKKKTIYNFCYCPESTPWFLSILKGSFRKLALLCLLSPCSVLNKPQTYKSPITALSSRDAAKTLSRKGSP